MPSLDYISAFSNLLPILIFLPFFSKRKELPVWVIFFYCIYSFINDFIILYRDNNGLSFSIFLYVFTIIEYILFSFLLYFLIKNKTVKKAILLLSLCFIAFCLYNIFDKAVEAFDSVHASVESILLIAYCIIYLYEQLNQPQTTVIYSTYTFWILIGLLIYLSGTFFLYTFAMDLPPDLRETYWVINLICNILKNVLFTISIFIHVKPPKNSSTPPLGSDYQPYLH